MKTTAIFGLLSALASQSLATQVVLGTHLKGALSTENQRAWISGQDPCTQSVVLSQAGTSPCGIRFEVGNFPDLHFEGCGGALEIWQSNNFLNNCQFEFSHIEGCLFGDEYEGKFVCPI